jgi:hypothetical protein
MSRAGPNRDVTFLVASAGSFPLDQGPQHVRVKSSHSGTGEILAAKLGRESVVPGHSGGILLLGHKRGDLIDRVEVIDAGLVSLDRDPEMPLKKCH